MKRLMDIILSSIAILILTPLLVPIMIILKFTGEGYVFYKQQRVGKNGTLFNLLKFATMLKDSPKLKGGNITSKDDPRVIPFGKFLRKYKINELPQLVNVLIGDMSIIGCRPIVMEHFDFFNSSTKKIIAKLKPGLSGISSIVFRDEEIFFTAVSYEDNSEIYSREIAPFKGELEIWYFNNQSIIVDIVLVILTIISIIKPASNFHNYFFKDLPKHSIFNPG